MSEEIENPAIVVPRAIVTTVLLNGMTGWAMIIAVLYCLGDIESVIVRTFELSCSAQLISLEYANWISFYTGLLQWYGVFGRCNSHDCFCRCASLVCGDRLLSDSLAHGMVVRSRLWDAIS